MCSGGISSNGLTHHGDLSTEMMRELLGRKARRKRNNARKSSTQRRFASSTGTSNPKALSCLHLKRKITQYPGSGLLTKSWIAPPQSRCLNNTWRGNYIKSHRHPRQRLIRFISKFLYRHRFTTIAGTVPSGPDRDQQPYTIGLDRKSR